MLARVGQPAHLVDVGVVAAAQLERIEVERERELVDRLLERSSAFHHAGRAKRVLGAKVRLHGKRQRPHVGAAVQGAGGDQHGEHPPASPHRDHGVGVDRGDRAVAPRTEAHRLAGRGAPPAVELLGMPVVDEAHRPAGDPGELGRGERLEAGSLLGAEPAADELRPHADSILAEPERGRELVARREHPLRRHPGGEVVAVPGGDGGVGFESGLQLGGCVERELDRDLGGCKGSLRIAAGVVGRLLGEALRVQPFLQVDAVRQHLEIEGERGDPGPRRFERVRRDDRDRLARVGGLAGENRGGGRQREHALGPDRGPNPGDRAGGIEVERADPPVCHR